MWRKIILIAYPRIKSAEGMGRKQAKFRDDVEFFSNIRKSEARPSSSLYVPPAIRSRPTSVPKVGDARFTNCPADARTSTGCHRPPGHRGPIRVSDCRFGDSHFDRQVLHQTDFINWTDDGASMVGSCLVQQMQLSLKMRSAVKAQISLVPVRGGWLGSPELTPEAGISLGRAQ